MNWANTQILLLSVNHTKRGDPFGKAFLTKKGDVLVLLPAEDDGHLEVRDDDGVEEGGVRRGHEDGAVLLRSLLA